MILNIGGEVYILKRDIISIISRETVESSKIFREFIVTSKREKRFMGEDGDWIRSYVLVDRLGQYLVYPSGFSSKTLEKRNNN